jgi:hypothetical protein
VTLEEAIMELTSLTPSGGAFRLGDHDVTVRYCSDCWEWEYRGNIYYDLQDLAEEVLGKGREVLRWPGLAGGMDPGRAQEPGSHSHQSWIPGVPADSFPGHGHHFGFPTV